MILEFKKDKLSFSKNNICIIQTSEEFSLKEKLFEFEKNIKNNDFFINEDFKLEGSILIESEIDLKKEFTLAKTSNFRKKIIEKIFNLFENDLELFFQTILNEEKINVFIEELSTFFKAKDYSLKLALKNKSIGDLIDNLFQLEISNSENEKISSKDYNQFTLKKVYLDLMLDINIKNHLIIIENYERYLLDNGSELIENLIKFYSKQNLIILTTTKNYFLKQNSHLLYSWYLHKQNHLYKIKFENNIIKKSLILRDFKGSVEEFENYQILAFDLIELKDIDSELRIFSFGLFSILDELTLKKTNIEWNHLNEILMFSIILFLKFNSIHFDFFDFEKLNFKNELLNFLLKKFI